jgi:probable rRNA maturation factor
MGVSFHSDEISFNVKNKRKLNSWILSCVSVHNKSCGDINVIFCDDEYLLSVNNTYLNHDYYTDIITFDYSQKDMISGDLFISISRVKENANELNIEFITELYRVIVHGVLHLLGYKDKTKLEKDEMRAKEDEMILLMP